MSLRTDYYEMSVACSNIKLESILQGRRSISLRIEFVAVILILLQSSCGKLNTLCIRSRDGHEYRFAIVTS